MIPAVMQELNGWHFNYWITSRKLYKSQKSGFPSKVYSSEHLSISTAASVTYRAMPAKKLNKAAPKVGTDARTDYTRWRLLDERGRQTWHYLSDDEEAEEWPQTIADKWFLGLPTVRHPSNLPCRLCNSLLTPVRTYRTCSKLRHPSMR